MATITRVITPVLPQHDFSSSVDLGIPTAGQTFINGAPVKLVAGELVASVSADVSLFGIALGPATYPAGIGPAITSRVPVFRAKAGQKLIMNLDSNGAAANNPAVGTKLGLKIEANGLPAVDVTNTAEPMFEIVQYAGPSDITSKGGGAVLDPATVINPRVMVEILAVAVQ